MQILSLQNGVVNKVDKYYDIIANHTFLVEPELEEKFVCKETSRR